jgi:hypothetical protein
MRATGSCDGRECSIAHRLAVPRQILGGMAKHPKHLYGKRAWPSKKTTWGRRLTGKRIQFLARR